MTRDEARKLLSGYATGSLTESERAALFNAALEDQDLFDELAGEQALKELLESPGARDRLVAALTPGVAEQPKHLWWPWAAALACGVAAFTVWMMKPRPVETPAQMAAVQEAADKFGPYVETPVQPVEPAPVPKPVPKVSSPKADPVSATNEPAAPPVAVAAEQPLLKTESQELTQPLTPQGKELPILTIRPDEARGGANAQSAFRATSPDLAAFPPLTYVFTPNRKLRITPSRIGVLQVTAGSLTLFARNSVMAHMPIELEIPEGVLSVRIEFTPDDGMVFIVTPSVPQ